MELDKANTKKILLIITFALVLFWGLDNLSLVVGFLSKIVAVITPFVMGLCFAFAINVLLRPIEKQWDKILSKAKRKKPIVYKLKRPICLIISTIIIVSVIFILLFMIVPETRRTIIYITDGFPQFMIMLDEWWDSVVGFFSGYGVELPQFGNNFNELTDIIKNFLSTSGTAFLGKTAEITTSIFSGVFNVVLGFVFSFYVLYQKENLSHQLKKTLLAFSSEKRLNGILEVTTLANKTFSSFVTGQLTEAIIIGVLCFIGMKIFSMPYAMMISSLVGFTALIPVFGAFIGTAFGALFILMVDPMKALWFIVFIVVLQQIEGNIIYPRVVGKSVGLPGIWVLAAVTVGGGLFGVLGILLSVPVCSVLYCLIKQSINKRLNRKKLRVKTV